MTTKEGSHRSPLGRERVRRVVHYLAALGMFAGVAASCGFRDDELLCEEALAQLQACCPELTARVTCVFTQGCMEAANPPQISVDAAECILSHECSSIAQGSRCEAINSALDEHYDPTRSIMGTLQCR